MDGRLTAGIGGLLLLCVLLLASVNPAGAATNTLANQTVAVGNNTASVYAEITNTSNQSVRVVFEGLNNSTATEVKNVTASATANQTVTVTYDAVDPANYSEYRVRVLSINGSTAENVSVGTLEKVAGGGGAGGSSLLGGSSSLGIVAVVVVLVGALALKN